MLKPKQIGREAERQSSLVGSERFKNLSFMKLVVFGILVVGIFTLDKIFISPPIIEIAQSWFAGDATRVMVFELICTTIIPVGLITFVAGVVFRNT